MPVSGFKARHCLRDPTQAGRCQELRTRFCAYSGTTRVAITSPLCVMRERRLRKRGSINLLKP
jgi:hypothetical protein